MNATYLLLHIDENAIKCLSSRSMRNYPCLVANIVKQWDLID